jgi:hypothetical protein
MRNELLGDILAPSCVWCLINFGGQGRSLGEFEDVCYSRIRYIFIVLERKLSTCHPILPLRSMKQGQ